MPTLLLRPSQLAEALTELSDADRVAVDTEFHAERRYHPQLFLLQLHLPSGRTFVLDALEAFDWARLGEVLAARPWVLHAGSQDLRILKLRLGVLPHTVLDTQIAAGLLHPHYPASYARLLHHWLSVKVDKGATLSDWSQRPLRQAQLDYAIGDVVHLFPLWDRLAEALQATGRHRAALGACEEHRANADAGRPCERPWLEVPNIHSLEPEEQARVAQLTLWRLEEAIRTDQPERAVLADGLLLSLARRPPTTLADFEANRRIPRPLVKRYGQAFVDVFRQAAPPVRVVRHRSREGRLWSSLQLAAELIAEQEQLGANLVFPKDRLHDLALSPPEHATPAWLTEGWRSDLPLVALIGFIRGQQTIRVDDGAARLSPSDR